MKTLFLLVVTAALILLILAVIGLTISNVRLRRKLKQQQTLMEGLDEPELWLPKAEREAHARKLLKREDAEYEQQMIARLTEVIQGNQPRLEQER